VGAVTASAPPVPAPPAPPLVVLSVGVVAMSTGAIFARLAEADPLAVSFWRCAVAAAALAPLGARRAPAELARLGRGDLCVLGLSGLFLALHFATWIRSLELTTVASSVLLVNTGPLWTLLLAPLLTRDRPGRGARLGALLGVAGGAVVAGGDLALSGDALVGDGLALAGGLFASLYLVAGRRLRGELSFGAYAALCYGLAALALLLLALALGVPLLGFEGETWLWLLLCGLVPQLVGHSCANWSLRWATSTLVAVSLLGEPVASTLLALAVLGEPPATGFLLGAPVLLAGILLTARAERPR
jgi:drug/metabolite transporter (DMT)-like permease